MPTLTTIDGREIRFSASSVTVLTNYDVFTHAAVTSIYAIRKSILETKELPLDFIACLGIQNDIAQLTRETGRPIR
jgi:hypothetical protein